jgi:ABC-type nitrate/sulfonate/bicarbonate transport system permease component
MRLSAPEASRRRVTLVHPVGRARGGGLVRLAWRLAVLAVALAIWQALSASGLISSSEFPSMTSSVRALWDQLDTSELWSAVASTLEGWAAGLLIGSVAAVAVGSLLGLSHFAYRSAIPVIEFFKTIPVVAILPIALTLYGPTLRERYLLVAFAVFWPLVIQVIYGVRSVEPTVLDTATALGVRRLRRFFVVILPSAAPFIATGLRIAAATALIVDIVAELIGGGAVTGAGGGSGVGVQILNVYDAGPTALPIMYAYILVAGLLGVVLAGIFALAERRTLHWHESQRDIQAGGHAA